MTRSPDSLVSSAAEQSATEKRDDKAFICRQGGEANLRAATEVNAVSASTAPPVSRPTQLELFPGRAWYDTDRYPVVLLVSLPVQVRPDIAHLPASPAHRLKRFRPLLKREQIERRDPVAPILVLQRNRPELHQPVRLRISTPRYCARCRVPKLPADGAAASIDSHSPAESS